MGTTPTTTAITEIDRSSSLSIGQKIALIKSIFRARTDVYAEYWEDPKSGRNGFAPVRTEYKKRFVSEHLFVYHKLHRTGPFEDITDKILQAHLEGRTTIGIYPLLPDNTCYFLAIDLDGKGCKKSAFLLHQIAEELRIPVYFERSRSGKGIHVWIFFSSAIPAVKARELGFSLLRQLKKKISTSSFKAFDRLFPNQDFLSGKGLGNLIVLPLQGNLAKEGKTVLLEPSRNLRPFPDSWKILKSVERLSPNRINEILAQSSGDSPVLVADGKLPIELDNQIRLPLALMPQKLKNFLRGSLIFHNPVFYEKQRKGYATWDTPRILNFFRKDANVAVLPRGFWSRLMDFLEKEKIDYTFFNHRVSDSVSFEPLPAKLFDYQTEALNAILKQDFGILEAPSGSGKTVIACASICERKERTLIIVHTKELAKQWVERVISFLSLSQEEVGLIEGKTFQPGEKITVATYQALRERDLKEITDKIGFLIVDECHRLPARTFTHVVRQFKSKYMLGLTATPFRKDHLEKLMHLALGPVIWRIPAAQKIALQRKLIGFVIVRETSFSERGSFQQVVKGLTADGKRNLLIAQDISKEVEHGKLCLILSERKSHCFQIQETLGRSVSTKVLVGNLTEKKRREALSEIRGKQTKVLIATGQLIGEGLDLPELSTLFLTFPVSGRAKLSQYLGRLLRQAPHKSVIKVYDYIDIQSPMLVRMFEKRKRIYRKLGFEIRDPNGCQKEFEF